MHSQPVPDSSSHLPQLANSNTSQSFHTTNVHALDHEFHLETTASNLLFNGVETPSIDNTPAQLPRSLLICQANINGQGPFNFLMDDGCNCNLVKPEVVKQASLTLGNRQLNISGVNGIQPSTVLKDFDISFHTTSTTTYDYTVTHARQLPLSDALDGIIGIQIRKDHQEQHGLDGCKIDYRPSSASIILDNVVIPCTQPTAQIEEAYKHWKDKHVDLYTTLEQAHTILDSPGPDDLHSHNQDLNPTRPTTSVNTQPQPLDATPTQMRWPLERCECPEAGEGGCRNPAAGERIEYCWDCMRGCQCRCSAYDRTEQGRQGETVQLEASVAPKQPQVESPDQTFRKAFLNNDIEGCFQATEIDFDDDFKQAFFTTDKYNTVNSETATEGEEEYYLMRVFDLNNEFAPLPELQDDNSWYTLGPQSKKHNLASSEMNNCVFHIAQGTTSAAATPYAKTQTFQQNLNRILESKHLDLPDELRKKFIALLEEYKDLTKLPSTEQGP